MGPTCKIQQYNKDGQNNNIMVLVLEHIISSNNNSYLLDVTIRRKYDNKSDYRVQLQIIYYINGFE